jgi:hypothetical protein
MTKRKIPKIMFVVWKDACCHPDRNISPDEIDEFRHIIIESAGILIKNDSKGVVLAPIRDQEGESTGFPLCIPAEYIIYKKYVK